MIRQYINLKNGIKYHVQGIEIYTLQIKFIL